MAEEEEQEREVELEIEEHMMRRGGMKQIRSNSGVFQQTLESILQDFRHSQSSLDTFLEEEKHS